MKKDILTGHDTIPADPADVRDVVRSPYSKEAGTHDLVNEGRFNPDSQAYSVDSGINSAVRPEALLSEDGSLGEIESKRGGLSIDIKAVLKPTEQDRTDSYSTLPRISAQSTEMSLLDSSSKLEGEGDNIKRLKMFLQKNTTLSDEQIAGISSMDDFLGYLKADRVCVRDSDGSLNLAQLYDQIGKGFHLEVGRPSIGEMISNDSFLATEIGGFIDTNSYEQALAKAMQIATQTETNIYTMDIGLLRQNLRTVKSNFLAGYKNAIVALAAKTNNIPLVWKLAADMGFAFDCATAAEIDLVRRVKPDAKILFSNPVRPERDVIRALQSDVYYFSVQSRNGVSKVWRNLPRVPRVKENDVELAFRIDFENEGAKINLSGSETAKFGTETDEVRKMISSVQRNTRMNVGLTVHLGSQNTSEASIDEGIAKICQLAEEMGGVCSINIGPGIPVSTNQDEEYDLGRFIELVNDAFAKNIGRALAPNSKAEIIMEIGRAIVAPAETLVIPIIETDFAKGIHRMHVNESVFGSFSDVPLHKMEYWFEAGTVADKELSSKKVKWGIFGITCDSKDKIAEVYLPENLSQGDCIIVKNAGAYMSSQHTGSEDLGGFNGIQRPKHYIFNYR